MRVLLIVLLFLFISALVIVSNNNLHLNNGGQAKQFASLYYSWLIDTGSNVLRTTGYIVGFNWLPAQSQNITLLNNSGK